MKQLILVICVSLNSAVFAARCNQCYGGNPTISGGASSGVSFDAVASSNPLGGSTPTTWSITVGACDNRVLTVGCSATASDSVTAMTVGGQAMTLSTACLVSGAGTQIFTYINPNSGAQTISATTASTLKARIACSAVSWCGGNQVTPIDVSTVTVNFLSGIVSSNTFITTGNNETIFDVIQDGNSGGPLTPTLQTRISTFTFSGTMGATSTMTATTSGTYQMGWTGLGGATPHCQASVAIKAQ